MEWFEVIMALFGGLGAFLIGMNMLSSSLTKAAHGKMQTLLNRTSKSRIVGVGIGAGITAIAQSSALTTVMVVGLVNAGVMTLFQGTAIIMGANIGTTITAWLVSLNSLPITSIFIGITAVGVFTQMFAKKEKIKLVGTIFAGLGLLFVGLTFLQDAMNFEEGSDMFNIVFHALSVIDNPFLLLLIGIAVTALVQSSSAVTTIIISMASTGLIIGGGGNAMYFLIIGSNIGTCITALISSIGANTNAKRASCIHLLFNLFGAVIFTVFLLLWPTFGDQVLVRIFPDYPAFQVAAFHTLFNVVCTLIFLPFINVFVKISNFIVRDKKEKEREKFVTEFDERLLKSPSVALEYLYQSTGSGFSYAMETLNDSFRAFLQKDVSIREKVAERNAELAQINKHSVSYLVKLSACEMSMGEEKTISSLHYVLNDIVRIGELADNLVKYTEHYVNDNLEFSSTILQKLEVMNGDLQKLYKLSLETYQNRDVALLSKVDELEDRIDRERRELISTHIERLNDGQCQPQNSSVFINLVGNLERAGDHITFIAHSIEQNQSI